MVTAQAPLPEQAPPHELNEKPPPGVGVNVTTELWVKSAVQVRLQAAMPAGELESVPEPNTLTVRGYWRFTSSTPINPTPVPLLTPLSLAVYVPGGNVSSSAESSARPGLDGA
jgi:hypothetical protein